MGAGEFEPWHEPIDARVLEGRSGTVLVAPTAAAHEGDEAFDRWASKGLAHYERLGVEARILPLKTRADASRPDVVEALEDAAVLFFSGGNPWRLAEAIRDTPFWERVRTRMDDGLVYAGCSAGVACLTERTYDSDVEDVAEIFKPGLARFRDLLFAPHWDTVDDWVPGTTTFIAGSVGPREVLIGIDEDTAMVGDGTDWEVLGSSGIHLLQGETWTDHRAGATFHLRLHDA
jgi:cyanophycinase